MGTMGFVETLLSILAGLGTIGAAVYAAFKSWRGRLYTRRLMAGTEQYFEETMKLYERSFEDWERDEPEEIERWLNEARRRRSNGDRSLEEYLLTAIWRQRPCGFFYGTFYSSASTLFVSYLVVDRGLSERVAKRVSKELLRAVQNSLAADGYDCKKLIAEVEVPVDGKTLKLRRRRKARIRRLLKISRDAEVPLRVLDAAYLQPKLDLRDRDKHEDGLLVLYARVDAEMPSTLPREEVEALLHFVYDELYGDCFMHDPGQDKEWRRYIADLRERAVLKLPERVRCLQSAPSSSASATPAN